MISENKMAQRRNAHPPGKLVFPTLKEGSLSCWLQIESHRVESVLSSPRLQQVSRQWRGHRAKTGKSYANAESGSV